MKTTKTNDKVFKSVLHLPLHFFCFTVQCLVECNYRISLPKLKHHSVKCFQHSVNGRYVRRLSWYHRTVTYHIHGWCICGCISIKRRTILEQPDQGYQVLLQITCRGTYGKTSNRCPTKLYDYLWTGNQSNFILLSKSQGEGFRLVL